MKFFADTAEIAEIRELAAEGLLDGVTTNPSLVHKSGRDFLEVVKEIAEVVDGPVSAEVVALDYDGMLREAEVLRKIARNIAIKVPLTPAGLKACKALTPQDRKRLVDELTTTRVYIINPPARSETAAVLRIVVR